ncbi:MAG TPA: response regulator [Candidatus Saccharimonadales bacterium]|jgi:CheY-like chemotaxis protein|nr:response regulator [Candidatus Saccharimonadales bacterium]
MDTQPDAAQSGKKFILVADDTALLARVLANKLTQAGYEVVIAGNGVEVLAEAIKRKPDLLLLDLIMPIKDGFTTLKELRADPNLADIKVIVTSDLSQADDMQKVQALGVLGAFDKSNLQEIVDQVPHFLGA